MSNVNRSTVTREISGKEYSFKLGTNAICNIEQTLSKPFSEIIEDIESGKVSMIVLRTMLLFALKKNHPQTSLEEAGDICDDLGAMGAGELIGECIACAFPEATLASEKETEGPTAN